MPGILPIVAEDLGVITPDVERLRDRFHLPGMKVFFSSPLMGMQTILICQPTSKAVVGLYTQEPTTIPRVWGGGNDWTSRQEISSATLERTVEAPGWQLLELGLSTSAALVVAPVPDLLHLDDAARFNTPGTVGGNWMWRLSALDDALEGALEGYGLRAEVWFRR